MAAGRGPTDLSSRPGCPTSTSGQRSRPMSSPDSPAMAPHSLLRSPTRRPWAVRFFRGSRSTQDRKSTRLNSSHGSISYAVFCLIAAPPSSTLFPYTTLFRSDGGRSWTDGPLEPPRLPDVDVRPTFAADVIAGFARYGSALLASKSDAPPLGGTFLSRFAIDARSEEHTSELQSR